MLIILVGQYRVMGRKAVLLLAFSSAVDNQGVFFEEAVSTVHEIWNCWCHGFRY